MASQLDHAIDALHVPEALRVKKAQVQQWLIGS
jgi:hypothetical protein